MTDDALSDFAKPTIEGFCNRAGRMQSFEPRSHVKPGGHFRANL